MFAVEDQSNPTLASRPVGDKTGEILLELLVLLEGYMAIQSPIEYYPGNHGCRASSVSREACETLCSINAQKTVEALELAGCTIVELEIAYPPQYCANL